MTYVGYPGVIHKKSVGLEDQLQQESTGLAKKITSGGPIDYWLIKPLELLCTAKT